MKTLVLSHGHPVFSKGGGELAAYHLWQGLNRLPGHEAWFVGRATATALHAFTSVAVMGERDYLIAGNAIIADLTATTPLGPDSDFASLLRRIDPDVVHFHHYVHLGIELLRVVRNVCPRARIVLTLHEFIAICMNNGQMVKTDGRLCHHASPRECHFCFRHLKPEDFFLRERYIKSFFALVDHFISPSHFLRQRYLDWGLRGDNFSVIENGLPEGNRLPPRPLRDGEARTRFAYLGQVNPYKGLDVILEAFAALPRKLRKQLSLDIYGGGLENQVESFQERIATLLEACGSGVRMHGFYEPEDVGRLMRDIDWVVMGSVWWENSPLVIQEAYKFGRPVICPNIGGMAEKVVDEVGGLTYRARDAVALAAVMRRAVEEPDLFDSLCATLPKYPALAAIAARHAELYHALTPGHIRMTHATDPGPAPLRLVVHIGAGKTGTSSIQQTLRRAAGPLRRANVRYLGIMLDHVKEKSYPWQRPNGTEDFHALGEKTANAELAAVLRDAIAAARADGITTLVWSNEWLFTRAAFAVPTLKALAADGIAVEIIAYVRRHDAWSRSSYVQWGLKHKTYEGPLLSHEEFRSRRPAEFARHLAPWREAFPGSISVRNIGESGDAVSDFLTAAAIPPDDIEIERWNQSPPGEELALRALFNDLIPGQMTPVEFDRTIQVPKLRFDVSPGEWLARLLPTSDDLVAEVTKAASDRAAIAPWLRAAGTGEIDTAPLDHRGIAVDNGRLLTALSQVVMKLALRVRALEAAGGTASEADGARPVIVLSASDEAAAGIRNLLNCHPDLAVSSERQGLLNGLAQTYLQLMGRSPKARDRQSGNGSGEGHAAGDPAVAAAAANPASLEEFRLRARALLASYFASGLASGQRWGVAETLRLSGAVLRLLVDVFPAARFILVTCHPVAAAEERLAGLAAERKWQRQGPDERAAWVRALLVEVRRLQKFCTTFASRNGERALLVRFEELRRDPQAVMATVLDHAGLDPDRFDWRRCNELLPGLSVGGGAGAEVASLVQATAEKMAVEG